jgi:predicted nucleic-acid-binding protein
LIGLDTNVLVRYFAQDDARQGALARKLIEQRISPEQPGFISLVALAELVWVLRSSYQAQRAEIIRVVEQMLHHSAMVVQEPNAVWLARDEYELSGADFSDALIAALGTGQGCSHTATFDIRACRIAGMELLK